MAVYMASGCSTMVGKMTAVWFPISAFVALGLDHSVANMFMIPLAMLRGAEITVSQMFLKNIIPVTLGSIVGGSLCVMMPFGTTFGKWFCPRWENDGTFHCLSKAVNIIGNGNYRSVQYCSYLLAYANTSTLLCGDPKVRYLQMMRPLQSL
jgi:hypothetical protein